MSLKHKQAIGLSSQLASTYRLFLRATSAAVLHHPTATRNIRKLYRPVFDEAVEVEVRATTTQEPETRKVHEQWLMNWNERIDNTLEFLHSSATNRGLAHRLTRNLGFLTDSYLKSHEKKGRVWDPQLPLSSPYYSIPPKKPLTEKEKRQKRYDAFDATAFQALGQVARLAEGRSDVSLGRLPASRSQRWRLVR